MTIVRDGLPFIVGATGVALVAFALALRARSWPLWLVGFVSLVVALGLAWVFRAPASAGAA
ncbi:MAG TPA: hypothetical protein PKE51_10485 [Gemmatimonadaceae bacterium]|nr:hypothetical protein [Gemmatimonadaceae bacterium]